MKNKKNNTKMVNNRLMINDNDGRLEIITVTICPSAHTQNSNSSRVCGCRVEKEWYGAVVIVRIHSNSMLLILFFSLCVLL